MGDGGKYDALHLRRAIASRQNRADKCSDCSGDRETIAPDIETEEREREEEEEGEDTEAANKTVRKKTYLLH